MYCCIQYTLNMLMCNVYCKNDTARMMVRVQYNTHYSPHNNKEGTK